MHLLEELKSVTDEFFRLHWSEPVLGAFPTWNEPWNFVGTLIGNKSQGVYALLNAQDSVIYIGVGASLGHGRYRGHGLGSRINSYRRVAPNQAGVPVKERQYVPVEKWSEKGLCSIATLEFEDQHAYLAYGLEAYLIHRLCPPHNVRNPAGSNA